MNWGNAEVKKYGSENGQTLAQKFGQGSFFANFQRFASAPVRQGPCPLNSHRALHMSIFLA